MHPALEAMRRISDKGLWALGFDRAAKAGRLGTYMGMLNRSGCGGYSQTYITAAKMNPGVDPMPKAN